MRNRTRGARGAAILAALAILAVGALFCWAARVEQVHREYWALLDSGQLQEAREALEPIRRTTRYRIYDLEKYSLARECGEQGLWEKAVLKLHGINFYLEPEQRQQELEAFRQQAETEYDRLEAKALEEARREAWLEDYFQEPPKPSHHSGYSPDEEEDPYDADEFWSEEDFYDYWSEDFADFYDAADYYEDHHHD